MKLKDFQDAKQKPAVELEKDIAQSRERLRGLQFDLAAGKIKNIKEIRLLKKNIAQLSTLVRESATTAQNK